MQRMKQTTNQLVRIASGSMREVRQANAGAEFPNYRDNRELNGACCESDGCMGDN